MQVTIVAKKEKENSNYRKEYIRKLIVTMIIALLYSRFLLKPQPNPVFNDSDLSLLTIITKRHFEHCPSMFSPGSSSCNAVTLRKQCEAGWNFL